MARGEVIRIRNEFYIRSSSARVDVRTRVLKQGDMYAVFDRFGDVETFGTGELGLFYQDTRFLSRLTLKLGKDRPLLLSSTVREDNAVLAVDATNPDVWRDSEIVVPRGTIHVFRSKILWDKACHERLRIHNYGRAAVDFVLSIEFGADFADIFELRGMHRERHGRRLEPEITDDGLVLAYEPDADYVQSDAISCDQVYCQLPGPLGARRECQLSMGHCMRGGRRFAWRERVIRKDHARRNRCARTHPR